jgi:hypothetical protein
MPNDERPSRAIETSRHYANFLATSEELSTTREIVWDAEWALDDLLQSKKQVTKNREKEIWQASIAVSSARHTTDKDAKRAAINVLKKRRDLLGLGAWEVTLLKRHLKG